MDNQKNFSTLICMHGISKHQQPAFTLIELLIVIGIIGTLASVTIVAINPNKQLNSAKDTARLSAVRELRNALTQYQIDNGSFPTGIPISIAAPICKAGITTDVTCVNLDTLVPKYVVALPQEASEPNTNYSGYLAGVINGRAQVTATAYSGYGSINSGLIGWWRMDEALGTSTLDASASGVSGTLTNGPVRTTGKIGNALSFDGIDDYVNLGTNASINPSGPITLTAWINTNILTNGPSGIGRSIIFNGDGNGQNYELEINRPSGHVEMIWGNSIILTSIATINTGTWYHLTYLRTGTTGNWTATLYINGVLDSSVVTTINPNGVVYATQIGGYNTFANNIFSGLIDDIRLYNRPLSLGEIQQIAAGNG